MASDSYRSDPKRAAELAVMLAAILKGEVMAGDASRIADMVVAMQKAARSSKRAAEIACNYAMTEAQQERAAKREERMQAKINEGLHAYFGRKCGGDGDGETLRIELGGDPRGPCATLHIPGQRGDGWGDGFAVY